MLEVLSGRFLADILTPWVRDGIPRALGALARRRRTSPPRPIRERSGEDRRRAFGERRSTPVLHRLRLGLWLACVRKIDCGPDAPVALNKYSFSKVELALLPEARRYRYATRSCHSSVSPEHALRVAMELIAAKGLKGFPRDAIHFEDGVRRGRDRVKAQFLVEEIAHSLQDMFDVEVADRRSGYDRRKSIAQSA